MAEPGVTTIVVNWRLAQETIQCLRSLERLETSCRIVVVDNGSGDGSAEQIAQQFPQAHLLALSSNVGFGAACNRAIAWALQDGACDFILLLNNDALIHPRALTELLEAAKSHPRAGILGAKVYHRDTPHKIWYAGARRLRGVLAPVGTGRDQLDGGQFETLREVDYVFGAAMLIRRQVLARIGLFDERFFLYLEDLDFCLRAQQAGFALLFVPQAWVWHKGGASTAQHEEMRRYYFVKSTIMFLRKHTVLAWRILALGFWLLIARRAILRDLIAGNVSAFRCYWSALISGLTENPSP